MSATSLDTTRTRQLAAAIAVTVAIDVAWVRAPFLAVLALPFALVAWRYRSGRFATHIALVVCCAAYAAIAVSFALANGLHGPAEASHARDVINPGDFMAMYVGGPIAVWLAVHVVGSAVHRRHRVATAPV